MRTPLETASVTSAGWRVRAATNGDAPLLADLGRCTFAETFSAYNRPEDMLQFLQAHFSPEHLAAELANPATRFYLAEADQGPIGYLKLADGVPPSCVTGPAPFRLERLYVRQPWHGKGVGNALMEVALEFARRRGAQTLWLGVWEHNHRALAFYRRWGFEQVGAQVFQLGADAQTDWMMSRPL